MRVIYFSLLELNIHFHTFIVSETQHFFIKMNLKPHFSENNLSLQFMFAIFIIDKCFACIINYLMHSFRKKMFYEKL